MDLEELIKNHAEQLEIRARANPFLKQKLKQLNPQASSKRPFLLRLTPLALLYSLLIFTFTFLNFQLIGLVKKEPPQKSPSIFKTAEIFQPIFPGSISQVFEEVFKWDE